jgi:hypothetical protein
LNSTFDENATTIFMPPDIGQNTLTTKRANRLCKNLSALFIHPKLLSLGFFMPKNPMITGVLAVHGKGNA